MLNLMIAFILPVLAVVESNNNPSAVGDNSRAIGILQIHKVFVDDVNRIYKTSFTYADRYSKEKSFEMAALYLRHYGKPNGKYLAQIFNGGPRGNQKAATKKYWQKCQEVIKQRRR